jgi:predicted RNA-binding Zn-ribbon protein involved in translation (DUF1610 family)
MNYDHHYHCATCGQHVASAYLCPDCGRALCTLACLRRHRKAAHQPIPLPSTGPAHQKKTAAPADCW